MTDHALAILALDLSIFAACAQAGGLVVEFSRVVTRRRQLKRVRRQVEAELDRFKNLVRAVGSDVDQEDAPRVH